MVVFEFDEETGKAVEQPQEKKEIQPEVVKSESSRLEKAVNDFEMKSVKRGQLVNATVVKVTSDGLLVDVGQKSEGFIPRAEASTRDDVELASTFKTGDMIQCRVVKIGDDDGMIILSKKRADFELVWDRLKEAKDNKEILTTVATKAVKGGLLVDVGVPAFVPRSQIDLNRNADPTKWVGKELKVRIIEVDRPTRRVVCSQKEVLEEDRERRREEFISNLKVGEIYEGTVVGLVEFGAFVDLGEGVEVLSTFQSFPGAEERPLSRCSRNARKSTSRSSRSQETRAGSASHSGRHSHIHGNLSRTSTRLVMSLKAQSPDC